MEIKDAQIKDWKMLHKFYSRIYREHHPLQNRAFWDWQYGDNKYGKAIICLGDDEEIVGHVGANFGGGIAWIINVYLDPEYRGKGILGQMYGSIRSDFPLAATSANEAGLGLYRKMKWVRYHNLERFVKINPVLSGKSLESICMPTSIDTHEISYDQTHYFKQPFVKGVKVGFSTGVADLEVGGLRLVDFEDIRETERIAWDLGFNWIDYVTSWNDVKVLELIKNGWLIDNKSKVPWRLNPMVKKSFCNVSFLSEEPLDKKLIVHRSFSDHGRVASIKEI